MKSVEYECGCTAGGDLIAPYCPIHGKPIKIKEVLTAYENPTKSKEIG